VVITPIRAPLRSKQALVPAVVPWTTTSTVDKIVDPRRCRRETAGLVGARRRDLGDLCRARGFVEHEDIGEGAADIDADHTAHRAASRQASP
jgi:hypothetical protein